ncbi:hypothetical protein ANN_18421 [Periplaneta americana]|uniref:Uncharacterized protein n=1 Tax=Periplaneta americana TaxID=6978 RepID=A0ABQ8SQ67_PERAM|nr:hypothetical protein ANN_18421 [Periplaneta americana]
MEKVTQRRTPRIVVYSSPDIIRNIKSRGLRWAGHVARMGESRNAYSVLVGRPEGKRSLGRPRRRWEDNIKMDLMEVGYDDTDWINLAQDREQWRAYERAAMNLTGSLKAIFLGKDRPKCGNIPLLSSLGILLNSRDPNVEMRRVDLTNWALRTSPKVTARVWLRIWAGFSRDGVVNFRNQHVWADENHHAVEETRHQHRFSINLWAGVLGDRLIGSYVLPQGSTVDQLEEYLLRLADRTKVEYLATSENLQHILLSLKKSSNIFVDRVDHSESDVEKKTKSVKIMLKAHSYMAVTYEEELWPWKVLEVKNNGAVVSCIHISSSRIVPVSLTMYSRSSLTLSTAGTHKTFRMFPNKISRRLKSGDLGDHGVVLGGRVAQLVEQLAADWKVRGSIPGGDRIFSRCQTFRTAPRFTRPPIKLNTGSFPGVKGGQSVVPTTPPHSSAEVMESMGLYLHAPQVSSWHVTGIPLPLPFTY